MKNNGNIKILTRHFVMDANINGTYSNELFFFKHGISEFWLRLCLALNAFINKVYETSNSNEPKPDVPNPAGLGGGARLQLLLCECTKAHLCEHGHYISLCKCTMNFCVSTGSLDVEPVFILIGFWWKKALSLPGIEPRAPGPLSTSLLT